MKIVPRGLAFIGIIGAFPYSLSGYDAGNHRTNLNLPSGKKY